MKISVQGSGYFDWKDPEASFKFISECGFDAVDFNIDNLLSVPGITKAEEISSFFDKSDEEIIEYFRPIKEAAEKYGISFVQMHSPFPVWVKDRHDVTEYVRMANEKCLMVCNYVGCPAIVVHPVGRTTKAEEYETNLEIYRALMPAAKKYGVTICLENLFRNFNGRCVEGPCADAAEAVWYIDKLNEEAGEDIFGFCFDLGHANLTAKNVRNYLRALGPRLTCLHIHDNDARSDLHMLPYTYTTNWGKDLVTNWEDFIEGLKEINYRGAINFETFRVPAAFPKEVKTELFKLIYAIGKYFADRIEGE